ncbi:MAG: DinB family protein [Saprospirales bacterium]|nr:DinB family protein [Saprospirales bacterium]MBK7336614.1 DinB family protein [Saprospirales bacterium]
MKQYRTNGAVGALLDEYEKALGELKELIEEVTDRELAQIVDRETQDPDCVSIQTILTHVVRSGYGYAISVRKSLGEPLDYKERVKLNTAREYQEALDDMFHYNERLFEDYPNLQLEETEDQKKILVSWGQRYDAEQIFEHAIVHILRHRRQIERFLLRIRNT